MSILRDGEILTEREKWLAERKNGIGASDAPIILGYSPWKNNVALWEEKTGRRDTGDLSNPQMQYGNDAEPLLRSLFALDFPEYKLLFTPYKIIRNLEKPFIFATPDGELEDDIGRNGGLEIKTAEIIKSQDWKKWDDQIPDVYFVQILHQMIATGWEFVKVKAQLKHYKNGNLMLTTRHYHFERVDYLDDIAIVEKEVTNFWEYVQSGKKPNLKLPRI
ncbi:MAG: YqaJ viral recombinase family protein [Eubacteriales bacterium]|nr:YqaJ viral recombinase family protein [Eubacteriales bacterium]